MICLSKIFDLDSLIFPIFYYTEGELIIIDINKSALMFIQVL